MGKIRTQKELCRHESKYAPCQFPIWKTDGSKCIFHSKLVEGKKGVFNGEFEKYLKTLEADPPNQPIYIDGYIFPDDLILKNINFATKFVVVNCEVRRNFDLTECEFNSDFKIRHSKIDGNVYIRNSGFNKSFIFNYNKVQGNLIYRFNTAHIHAGFLNSSVNGCFLIGYSTFLRQIDIYNINVEDGWHFYSTDFSIPQRARFRNLNFFNVNFFDSKLLDIDFIGVKWKNKGKRLQIGDEIFLMTKQIPSPYHPIKDIKELTEEGTIIESLYLQLCANYDNIRLFTIAGKFYISAMEMRRQSRGSWLMRNLFSWEAWYRYISNYGQSSSRALAGILLMLVVCSVIILFDPNFQQLNNITSSSGLFQNISATISSFLTAFKYNLYYLIRPVGITFESKISLTAFVTAWERIIVLVLGTFFLLALRRRFRRN